MKIVSWIVRLGPDPSRVLSYKHTFDNHIDIQLIKMDDRKILMNDKIHNNHITSSKYSLRYFCNMYQIRVPTENTHSRILTYASCTFAFTLWTSAYWVMTRILRICIILAIIIPYHRILYLLYQIWTCYLG